MGLGGGRKVSRRGLIIIAALLFGIALSSRHTVDQNQIRSTTPQPNNILAMLSKKPTSGQLRRTMARNTALTSSGIATAARNSAVAGRNLTVPTQLNTVHRTGGALKTDETWYSTKTYVLDSEVTIPDGTTLAVQPGTVIKIVGPGGGIHVQQGGTFMTNGTDEDPVYITSYRNDVVGGNTSTAMIRASVGDYLTAITLDGGAHAVLANTKISYAEVGVVVSGSLIANNVAIGRTNNAITSYGGEIRANNILLGNNSTAMLVRGGDVIVRGAIKGYTGQAIQACGWGSDQCSVDASYVSWQDGTSSGSDAVCGQVLVDASSLAIARDCSGDGSFPSLHTGAINLQSRIDAIRDGCAAAGQDPCDVLVSANNDLDNHMADVSSTLISVPQDIPSAGIASWADELQANLRGYIDSRVTRTIEPFAFKDALHRIFDALQAAQNVFDSSAR